MKSLIQKRSVVIGGHKTSVSLEKPFWDGLREIADAQRVGLSDLLRRIDRERDNANLSSSIRIFVYKHFRSLALGEAPHRDGPNAAVPFARGEASH